MTLGTMADQSVPLLAQRRSRAIPIGLVTCGYLVLLLGELVLLAAFGGLAYPVAFSAASLALAASLTGISAYNLAAERWHWPKLTAGWPRAINRFVRRFQGWLVPAGFAIGLLLGHLLWQ